MKPLDKALQYWKGPEAILSNLENNGYHAHDVYRKCVRNFCQAEHWNDDLDLYWIEIAKEHVSSAGSDFDLGRNRQIRGYYKSNYIDSLLSNSDRFLSKFPIAPSVHPCVHAFMSEIKFVDPGLYGRTRKAVEEEKEREFMSHGLKLDAWDGNLRSLNRLLDGAAYKNNFEILSSKKIYGNIPTITYGILNERGLIFYLKADNGVREPLAPKLPLEFWIGFEKESDGDFFVSDFRQIIPGFEQYSYYDSPESAVLGVHALVYAFGELAKTF